MDPESIFVILPCWGVALGLELLIVWLFIRNTK